MSGGSHNYAFRHVDEFDACSYHSTPLRAAFNVHLRKVAEAMRAVEWVDSCDCLPGQEEKAIRDVLGEDWEKVGGRGQKGG